MTMMHALNDLYGRLFEAGEAPDFNHSMVSVGYALEIDMDGNFLRLTDIRSLKDGDPRPVRKAIPAVQRTSGVLPRLGCDYLTYVLGVGFKEEKEGSTKRIVPDFNANAAEKHAAFLDRHLELFAGTNDPHLAAFLRFMESWEPEQFNSRELDNDALVHTLQIEIGEGDDRILLHEHPVIVREAKKPSNEPLVRCLVTGEEGPLARTHLPIKGVWGSRPTGGRIVTFNQTSFCSYGKDQGENAPISEKAAFNYVTALNTLLAERGEQRRNALVGDTTTVFWAKAPEAEAVDECEWILSSVMDPPTDADEASKVRDTMRKLSKGQPSDFSKLDPETEVFLLGLAPNSARLVVRFWFPGTVSEFSANALKFWEELTIEPEGWTSVPAIWSIILETVVPDKNGKRKMSDADPMLSGEILKSVLTGSPLPRSLLSKILTRINKDRDVNARRAAICRAIINQTTRKEKLPVSLDPTCTDEAYLLGRLFALLEDIQIKALPTLNATIRDKFFCSAAATPARIFPQLERNISHHLNLIRRGGSGYLANWFDRQIAEVKGGLGRACPASSLSKTKVGSPPGTTTRKQTKSCARQPRKRLPKKRPSRQNRKRRPPDDHPRNHPNSKPIRVRSLLRCGRRESQR